MIFREEVAEAYRIIQDEICRGLEEADGKGTFSEELWDREEGGGGRSRVMENGNVIEKGGVNFSAVHGKLPSSLKKAFDVNADEFFATGVSIVIHPDHPWIPVIHMNIRYFEMPGSGSSPDKDIRWFGGGIDVTPHYIIAEDARFFHNKMKNICDHFNPEFYPRFKSWADDYFFIKHRNETRGIGGIFYDRLTPKTAGIGWPQILEFSKSVGRSFLPVYTELITRNKNKIFTPQNKEWQNLRRSRYAEFNLVYDAGTKFGLETNGRIESILMSLPPQANWKYNFTPVIGSEEENTQKLLKKGISWI